jgi:hypothetical protein
MRDHRKEITNEAWFCFFRGKRHFENHSEQFESPFEANMGGAETMYPEYREKLRSIGGIRIPAKPFDPR